MLSICIYLCLKYMSCINTVKEVTISLLSHYILRSGIGVGHLCAPQSSAGTCTYEKPEIFTVFRGAKRIETPLVVGLSSVATATDSSAPFLTCAFHPYRISQDFYSSSVRK